MNRLFVTFVALVLSFVSLAAEDARIYELRVYHARPGKLDALHARFRDHTVALFERHGMEQLGYFVPIRNKDELLVYWLAYPSKEARDRAWKSFGNDPEWKAAYAASTKDGKLVAKIKSRLLTATDYSPAIEALIANDGSGLYEWRTYTTREGKLPDINARFRDHTCALFEKHGMTNLAYWTNLEGQDGAGVTLTYLIAHANAEARRKSFGGFRKDPAWQAARKASEEDGKILIKGGVESMMLVATDYSPRQK